METTLELDGDNYAVPDVPHMEIMYDALEHTLEINGSESLQRFDNLTQAQHYAVGILRSHGMLRGHGVEGMEGVFSAIGDGFKAVWDFICKTFKSIWDFFFSRDAEKEAKDAKDDIKDKTDELKAADAGTQSDEDANKQASKMAPALGDSAAGKALKDAKSPAEKKKAIKAALAEYAKMNDKGKAKLKGVVDKAVNAKNALIKAAADGMKAGEAKAAGALSAKDHPAMHLLTDMSSEITKHNMGEAVFLKTLQGATSIDTVQGAISFGTAASANIDRVKALSDIFNKKKGAIDSIITATEGKLKKAKDANDKKELTAEVGALRTLMVGATRMSKLIEANFTHVKNANAALVGVFGIGDGGSGSAAPETDAKDDKDAKDKKDKK